jgi:hypothetical protein
MNIPEIYDYDQPRKREAVGAPGIQIRAATRDDLPRLTEIYNHYVVETPITFDLKPWAAEECVAWFEQFATTGRYPINYSVFYLRDSSASRSS